MKLVVKIVTPLVAVLAVLGTAVAVAAPGDPKEPYPDVPANARVCLVLKKDIEIAQNKYDHAKAEYQRLQAAPGGAVSAQELRAAERAVYEAAIELNKAKYKEADCRNGKGADPKKVCKTLVLELQRVVDELAYLRELERIATAELAAAAAVGGVAVAPAELARLGMVARDAKLKRERAELAIQEQRDLITAEPNCNGFPVDRPAPPAPPAPPTSSAPTVPPATPTSSVPTVSQPDVPTSAELIPMPSATVTSLG